MKLDISNIKSHKLNTPYPTIGDGKSKPIILNIPNPQIGHDKLEIPQIGNSRP